jgi:hypothetical protein
MSEETRSRENAESLVANENQGHEYSKDESPEPCQGEFEGKGESAERQVKASPATLGRHVNSAKDGAAVSKEREVHVLGNRKATEKLFSKRKDRR